MKRVCITVDMEQDCPPYLQTWSGAERGTPLLLELFAQMQITATFFTIGELARRYPAQVEAIVNSGHELGGHGDQHRRFDQMNPREAEEEIAVSTATLREFFPVTSFRAPNLRMPVRYLSLLSRAGYRLDSSQGRYSSRCEKIARTGGLTRVPASVTSSVLRLPWWMRKQIFSRLIDPVVLFVHPWEFVDFRHTNLRLDCRFRTGAPALQCLREAIQFFGEYDGRFVKMCDLA